MTVSRALTWCPGSMPGGGTTSPTERIPIVQFTHPSQAVGRGGCVNPDRLRAALIAAGLLRPRSSDGLSRLRVVGPRLEIDALGRAVAAARVSGELDYYDCGDCLDSWIRTNFSRLLRRRGEP